MRARGSRPWALRRPTPSPAGSALPSSASGLPTSAGLLHLGEVGSGKAYASGKRAMDLILASVVLVVSSPLLLLVTVLIRATSPGPALFHQTRVGKRGEPFLMLKFRTMRTGCDDAVHREYVRRLLADTAEPQAGLYKLADDRRITRVGRALRTLSIDELPQLLNVLMGDMSLVGPRPALPFEAVLFPEWAAPRYLVAPGVTGLWQVSGRNRLTMLQGLKLDVEYVERRSLAFDLLILARTVPAVLGRGAR
jgi:lipopolysaccharide/colanic/teichoic acid biosynthesis glycosyltransferase